MPLVYGEYSGRNCGIDRDGSVGWAEVPFVCDVESNTFSGMVPTDMSPPTTASAGAVQSPERWQPRTYDCGYLPLEDQRRRDVRRWWDSLVLLVRRPFARTLTIREPVGHASVIRLLWAVRWPTWLLCSGPVFFVFVASVLRELGATGMPGGEFAAAELTSSLAGALEFSNGQVVAPSLMDATMPSFFVRSLRVWLLLMVPLGIPLVYFLAGIVAHVVLVLTGGAPRSMGTTMRATGLAFVPVALLYGVLDVLASYAWVTPTTWALAFSALTIWLAFRLFAGVRCLHGLKKRRALSVLPPALLILTSGVVLRAALVLPHPPGAQPPAALRYGVDIAGPRSIP